MHLMSQFIRRYTTFLLISYLTSLTIEVQAPAAPDYWMDEPTTAQTSSFEQLTTTSYHRRKGQEHGPSTVQPTTKDNSNGDQHPIDQEETEPPFVFCGLPPTFRYAEIEEKFRDQLLFYLGSVVSYKCKTNYETIRGAASKAECMANGNWSIPKTFCKPNFCGLPPRLDYAEPTDLPLDQSTFSKGSKVSFTCRPGFVRSSQRRQHATCENDGTWSLPANFCKPKSCGNPGEVENAEMEVKDFLFGSRVTYTCNAGYRMLTKRNYRDCQADGTWSNTLPICEVQLCPPPTEIRNGEVSPLKDEYSYLDSVTYSCRGSLSLIGERSMSCKEDGQWSAEAPKCIDVNCPTPYVNNARRISGISGPYRLNSVVIFKCNQDYVIKGSDVITCKENSQWEPAPPKCLGVCKNLPFISYAELAEPLTGNQILEGTSLKFKCKAGYDPVPDISNVLTCLGSRWSSYERFCTPKFCGNPGPIENGYISTGTYYYGSSIIYACLSGYKIKESTSRTCQADGKWSLPIPECEGFCYAPPELEFAMLSNSHIKEIFFIGDKVGYKCSQGYTRDYQYENSLTCLGILKWSDPQQFCSRISCGPPKEIPNGVYKAKDFLFGSEAVYTCSKGYKLKTRISSRKCQANGQWSVPAPACEVHRCPPPEDLENGSYSNKQVVYNYLDSVTYWCNNLTLVGEASISCTEKENWTSGAPECKPVCKLPSQLQYGELEQNPQKEYFEIGTVLKYKCRPGYVAIENKSNQVICHEDLKWSKPEVFCKRLSCGNPGEIPHGKIHFSDFLFESRVNYTCNEGYTMISRYDFRYCQADGTWNGTSPVCKESICDKIWELQEEARKCTSTPDEWIKYLQVQHLYLQIENLKLDIEIKKKKLSDESTTDLIGETP